MSAIVPIVIVLFLSVAITAIALVSRRDWRLVASQQYPFFRTWNGHKVEGSDFTRTLVLERCAITGKEQAYYHDGDGVEWVPVSVAKAKLGIKDTPPSP